jgi:hypothetical protein
LCQKPQLTWKKKKEKPPYMESEKKKNCKEQRTRKEIKHGHYPSVIDPEFQKAIAHSWPQSMNMKTAMSMTVHATLPLPLPLPPPQPLGLGLLLPPDMTMGVAMLEGDVEVAL